MSETKTFECRTCKFAAQKREDYEVHVTTNEHKANRLVAVKKYHEKAAAEAKIAQKKYYEANKEQKIQYSTEYTREHKDSINARRRTQKIQCVCGSVYAKSQKSRHEVSDKHCVFIRSNEIE